MNSIHQKRSDDAPLRGKKLGILISAGPKENGFRHGLRLAAAALEEGVDVYVYCLDEAVAGLNERELQHLREAGLKLYACAYGALRRSIACGDEAVFAGLTVLSDIIASTDRFLSFC